MTENKVLCIDDSQDNCELFSFILSEAGYQVEVAHSLSEAKQFLKNNQFSLCAVDISLPDGTGFELIEQIRLINPSTKIIVCSGDSRHCTQQQIEKANVQAFFRKPLDFEILLDRIAKLLN
jgi:CheY-like chemotaxis protein